MSRDNFSATIYCFLLNTQIHSSISTDPGRVSPVRDLYNSYGAMLLGFIFEIVKNHQVAERYLIEVFNDLSDRFDEYAIKDISTLSQLQILARKKLKPFFETVKGCDEEQVAKSRTLFSNNKYIEQMTAEQQLVFCGIHYHGKTIAVIAAQLNKPEDEIRRLLKDSFTHIRNSHARVH